MSRIIVALYVENISGVLTRVSSMFTRRGYNIDTLSVGETENRAYSRMTITISGTDADKLQVVNQLSKLHSVKKVEILDEEHCVRRELMLVKVRVESSNRQDILAATNIFRGNVIDYSKDAVTIEVTGEASKLDAFLMVMEPFGIIETARTGLAALERGEMSLVNK